MSRKRIRLCLYVLAGAIFLGGITALAYPYIADWWNARKTSQDYAAYMDSMRNLDSQSVQEMLQAARKYNLALRNNSGRFTPTESQTLEYTSTLNASGTGIICYVEIPKISVRLPVYHGTSDAVLQVAAGHIEGSSFPIGESGCHAVISGHSGLASAMLFTELGNLEIGDKFYITVLGNKLEYVVDEINTVLPDDFKYFEIYPNRDYVTLMTCTPFGVNTHRLLVRGSRVDYTDGVNRIKVRFTIG